MRETGAKPVARSLCQPPTTNDGSMPFACIFVPDFPVEAILRAEPELRAQPVAVLEGKPPLQKVFATNANARAISIDAGMTKIQVEPWTELILRPRSAL